MAAALQHLHPRTSHPCGVLPDMNPPQTDQRAGGLQLRFLCGQRVRARASDRVQTDTVTVGSAISLFSGAGGRLLGIEPAGFAILLRWNGTMLPKRRAGRGTVVSWSQS